MVDELETRFALPADAAPRLERDGFVRLANVVERSTLAHFGAAIDAEVARAAATAKPMAERTTYERAFLQVMNLWTRDVTVRRFVMAPRFARIAAELLGVAGVRLYHDQALYKEAGGGPTPWHADQYYWPLTSTRSLTLWIPLDDVPLAMGPLAFSVGSHRVELGRDLPISDESERTIGAALRARALPLHEAPFVAGDVSAHLGWTFHRAGPNGGPRTRRVMTIIYIDAEMRVTAPRNANQQVDLATWFPGLAPGDRAASPLNPVVPLAPPAPRA